MFPVDYPIPKPLWPSLRDTRVVVVNDVINAGSAVRGTVSALRSIGSQPVAVGSLATLGEQCVEWAEEEGIELITLAKFPLEICEPDSCDLCGRGVPLIDRRAGFA